VSENFSASSLFTKTAVLPQTLYLMIRGKTDEELSLVCKTEENEKSPQSR
jgi:hypothetical protein